MKRGRRVVSFLLALVMICSLMVNAGAAESQKEIKAYLNYDITVTYNGEAQTMTDAAGNAVYPVSYNGTTYLPVRAVSNMLGVAVEWDGATQTVILSDSSDGRTTTRSGGTASTASGQEEIKAYLAPGITVKYNGEIQTMTDAAGNIVYPVSYNGTTYLPVRAVSNMLGVAVDWDGATQTVLLGRVATSEPSGANDIFHGAQTSKDAKVLGENHIGYEWTEIDWSTACDSYVRAKVNKLPGPSALAKCYVRWNDNGKSRGGSEVDAVELTEGEWVNIPLTGGNTEYLVEIRLAFRACEHYLTDEENAAAEGDGYNWLTARFNAEITNPDGRWLMSTYKVDWEHAPKTCEKALEITKDCKTDAEKITAVFKWVSQNIKYDKELYESDVKAEIARKTAKKEPAKTRDDYASEEEYLIATFGCSYDPIKGAHIIPKAAPTAEELEKLGYTDQNHLDLDYILTNKTGVCAHYVALTVGMLRSLGIPCKYVSGYMYTGKTTKGYNDDRPGWGGHGWVAVSPDVEGLNLKDLGAGTEPDGWIRLDPTNANFKDKTSNDKNYEVTDNC